MGLVFIARRKKDSKLYALKTFRGWEQEREALIKDTALFRKESLVWITLGKHRNIVQACWFDLDGHYRPFLIMEYVEGSLKGVTLEDYIKSSGKIGFLQGIRFTLETLNGLIYAQRTINKDLAIPFIHRDIKPANLLITKDGILKVTDFGLVMCHGGTPLYKAPEQEEGKGVEEKTDVYALGWVLYEMLTGHLRNREIKAIDEVPAELNRIIERCLAKSPDGRPNFVELQDELQTIYLEQTGKTFPLYGDTEPLSAEDLNGRGSGFAQLGYHEKALECYNVAITLDSNDPRYYLNRGNAYLSLKKIGEAIGDYQKAISLDPECVEAYLGLGNLLIQQGEYKKALKCFDEGKKVSPREEPMLYVSIGSFYAWQKHYDNAEKYFRKALSIRSDLAEAYLGLGNTYLCQKDYERAEINYQKAIKLNLLYRDAYLNLARLYQLMGCPREREDTLKILDDLINCIL
ncbi:MAG: tetratricopeptide repeat protein [bacterium]